MILPFSHDSALRWKEVLGAPVRSQSSSDWLVYVSPVRIGNIDFFVWRSAPNSKSAVYWNFSCKPYAAGARAAWTWGGPALHRGLIYQVSSLQACLPLCARICARMGLFLLVLCNAREFCEFRRFTQVNRAWFEQRSKAKKSLRPQF